MAGNKGFYRNNVRNKQTKNNNKDKNTTYQNCPPSELIIEECFLVKIQDCYKILHLSTVKSLV